MGSTHVPPERTEVVTVPKSLIGALKMKHSAFFFSTPHLSPPTPTGCCSGLREENQRPARVERGREQAVVDVEQEAKGQEWTV